MLTLCLMCLRMLRKPNAKAMANPIAHDNTNANANRNAKSKLLMPVLRMLDVSVIDNSRSCSHANAIANLILILILLPVLMLMHIKLKWNLVGNAYANANPKASSA